jgi:hypothetical protein
MASVGAAVVFGRLLRLAPKMRTVLSDLPPPAATVRKTISRTPPARAKLSSQINGAKNEVSVNWSKYGQLLAPRCASRGRAPFVPEPGQLGRVKCVDSNRQPTTSSDHPEQVRTGPQFSQTTATGAGRVAREGGGAVRRAEKNPACPRAARRRQGWPGGCLGEAMTEA